MTCSIRYLLLALLMTAVLLILGCGGEETPELLPTPSVSATAKVSSTPRPTGIASIKLDVKTSTWLENEQPYNVYGDIKQKLEEINFSIVPLASTDYDALLSVDYAEKKGNKYLEVYGYMTNIECNIVLKSSTQQIMFEKRILVSSPAVGSLKVSPSYEVQHRDNAVYQLNQNVYFYHLGDFIAVEFGEGDEISVLINALKDTPYDAIKALGDAGDPVAILPIHECLINARLWEEFSLAKVASEALIKLGDPDALEPLIVVLKNENQTDFTRAEAATALGQTGGARAIQALTEALQDESYVVARSAEDALKQIKGE